MLNLIPALLLLLMQSSGEPELARLRVQAVLSIVTVQSELSRMDIEPESLLEADLSTWARLIAWERAETEDSSEDLRESATRIIPVNSEHRALPIVFQSLRSRDGPAA